MKHTEETIRAEALEEEKIKSVINACAQLSKIAYADFISEKDQKITELLKAIEVYKKAVNDMFDIAKEKDHHIQELVEALTVSNQVIRDLRSQHPFHENLVNGNGKLIQKFKQV